MPTKALNRARRAPATDKKAAVKKTEEVVEAAVDFPQEGEPVMPGHYAVRISAQPGYDVEISTNGKDWSGTRPSVGFHWFDWTPSRTGRTVIAVRVKSGKGRWKNVCERECIVVDGSN